MYLQVILRNIFSNWLSYAVSSLVAFVLAPFVVHQLGNVGYGVWTLVISLTGYFGLLDLGIRSSVGRFVARYVALNEPENVSRTISTAFVILAGAGILALIATVVLYFSFGAFFKVDDGFASAARSALLISGVTISFSLPMGVFGAVLLSLERFDVSTGITVVGVLIRSALTVVFLKLGYGLVALALITLLVCIAEYCTLAFAAKALYPLLRLRLHFVEGRRCRELFGFGIYRFIWIIANQLIFYTDSVVIGIFLGAGAITYYAIAGSVINYGRYLVSLATDTLYPSATRLHSNNDMAGLRELQIFGTQIGLLIGLPVCLGFVYFGNQFITLWMGAGFGSSAGILSVLTIAQVTSMSQYISALILAGMARHKVLAYLALAEGVANVLLSVFLVQKIGLIGVAWGTVIPHTISTAIIIPIYMTRTLNMGILQYVTAAYARPLICAIPVAAMCYGFSVFVVRLSWAVFAGEVIAVSGTFAILSYFICLNSGQRSMMAGKLRNALHRGTAVNEA